MQVVGPLQAGCTQVHQGWRRFGAGTGLSIATSSSVAEPLTFPLSTQAIQTVERLVLVLGVLRSACRARADLVLENLALRHQLGVLMQ